MGDIGRSPRALYHALALARVGVAVEIVSLVEGELPDELRAAGRIAVHRLPDIEFAGRHGLPRPLFIGFAGVRAVVQAIGAATTLARAGGDTILVQVPPALPTLAVARAVAAMRGARLIIDWHDFGHTQLALRVGATHPLVAAARWAERALGRLADGHLCVSEAMARTLASDFGLREIRVLHDRPAARFQPLPDEERAAVRRDLAVRLGCPELGTPGVALAVSPTSWSPDEDFELLLEAAATLDARASLGGKPAIVFLITGRGPGREAFERRAAAAGLRTSRMVTAWLGADEYPRAIAAADFGICLHRSSSGVDLPMKVQDMLGAGLPVLAYDYGACLRQAVVPERGGLTFVTATELGEQVSTLLASDGAASPRLAALRKAAASAPRRTWEEEWREAAAALILGP